jgi:hypothetical protein
MPDEPKAPPQWQNNKKLEFNGLKELLVVVKERTEDAIAAKKAELAQLLSARDSLRK